MAINFGNAINTSTHYYYWSTVPVSAFPVTCAAWCYPDNTNNNDWNILQIQDSASSTNYIRFGIGDSADTGAVGRIQAYLNPAAGGGSNSVAWTSASVTYNAWNHAACKFTSATDRSAYLNGGNKGTDADSMTPTWGSLDTISIASERDSTPDDGWSGRLAHVAVWAADLTDAEILLLSKGYPPYLMRTSSLVFYAPLNNTTTVKDLISNATATTGGTPTNAEGPHVMWYNSIMSPVYATATNPIITDVNTTESWTDGDTGLVIAGSNFV